MSLTSYNASATLEIPIAPQTKRIKTKMKKKNDPFIRLLSVLALVIMVVFQTIPFGSVSAQQITVRSFELQAGVSDGGSKAGGVVNHKFTFTLPSVGNTNVGSIKFEYCTTAAGVPDPLDCTMPTGLVTTSATAGTQTGATGFTMVNTTNGAPYLTRTTAAVPAGTIVSYILNTITNPTAINASFFVRIKTYASTNVSGAYTDSGTVTASTAEPIFLDGIMPESLVFCTGGTVVNSIITGLPDCSTATSGVIHFNQLFSPTDTATSISQMAASTNAGSGYVISVNGPTLTSGSNNISAMNALDISRHGVGQFGLNLMANTVATSTIAIGTNVTPAPNATNYRGQAATNYSTIDSFKFTTGNIVADSTNGGAGPTDAQIFTVSYIANVPGSQAAGTYETTLTYIATPTF